MTRPTPRPPEPLRAALYHVRSARTDEARRAAGKRVLFELRQLLTTTRKPPVH